MDLVEAVYCTTAAFPREEVYGQTSQLRRAAVSIPSNIAEGNSRDSTRDYLHFLNMAYGSVKEVETQVLIAQRLRYTHPDQITRLMASTAEVARLISGLVNSLKKRTVS